MDDNYPPFVFRTADGKLQGILIDQWRLWQQQTGINVTISAMDWADAIRRMRAGEFDVIDTIFQTDERTTYLDFTTAYARLDVPIFFDRDIAGISDIASLQGFAVAAKSGDAAVDLLRQNGVTNLLLFNSYQSIVAAAKDHKVNVFVVDRPPALYYLNKFGINNEFRQSAPINVGEFHRAVKKGDRALLNTIERGFAKINPADLKRIEDKWYGSSLSGSSPYLHYLTYAAAFAALLILVLVTWNRVLSREVGRRTLALRASEERFRQVVENIDEVFWMTTVDKTQMLYISPGYEKIWGRSCESLYQSPHAWAEAIASEDRERVRQAAQLKQISGEYNEEYRIVRPDGSVRWIRDCAFPVRDSSGEVFRIAGVAEDITAHRELEEQIRRSQKMEAIGELASGIAHDFNNVLSVINGNAELALQDITPEHAAFMSVREISKAGSRARSLVQQILALTRQQPVERSATALAPVVEETLGFLRVVLPSTVELSVDLDAQTPNVLANATQIQQVVLNICTNAWHALEAQRGRIEVRLRTAMVDADLARANADLHVGMYACLSIRDTGKGMDAATMQRIFEPFFTTKSDGKGTGLGLSVVQRILKSHDAAIVVSSDVLNGSAFELYFPAAAPISTAEPMLKDDIKTQGDGEHIMYIDDEESIVLLTTRVLERRGYKVSGFIDPQAALDAFSAAPQQFDLVVTDYNMVGDTGMDVANKLLAIRSDIPVLLTSGYVTEDMKDKAQRIGIRQVIYKPNSVDEFCDAVQSALQQTRRSKL